MPGDKVLVILTLKCLMSTKRSRDFNYYDPGDIPVIQIERKNSDCGVFNIKLQENPHQQRKIII